MLCGETHLIAIIPLCDNNHTPFLRTSLLSSHTIDTLALVFYKSIAQINKMGNNNNAPKKSRRDFFSIFSSTDNSKGSTEMVKMLTADGKLVEVSKEMLDQVKKNQRASNKEIYNWMNNPSKKNNS